MAYTSGNLFAGGATIMKIAGVDVGATRGGIRLRRESDWLDFEIDQVTIIVKKELTLGRMFIETELAEPTLANIRTAWSIPSAALTCNSLQLQEASGSEEVAFYAEGPTVTGFATRFYTAQRCVAMADGEVSLSRGTETGTPINLEVMAEGTTPERFGAIQDI